MDVEYIEAFFESCRVRGKMMQEAAEWLSLRSGAPVSICEYEMLKFCYRWCKCDRAGKPMWKKQKTFSLTDRLLKMIAASAYWNLKEYEMKF